MFDLFSGTIDPIYIVYICAFGAVIFAVEAAYLIFA